jgi:hypothetical protein
MLPKTAWGKRGHRGDVGCKTAFPPKAEVHRRSCYVSKVPIVLQNSSLRCEGAIIESG